MMGSLQRSECSRVELHSILNISTSYLKIVFDLLPPRNAYPYHEHHLGNTVSASRGDQYTLTSSFLYFTIIKCMYRSSQNKESRRRSSSSRLTHPPVQTRIVERGGQLPQQNKPLMVGESSEIRWVPLFDWCLCLHHGGLPLANNDGD